MALGRAAVSHPSQPLSRSRTEDCEPQLGPRHLGLAPGPGVSSPPVPRPSVLFLRPGAKGSAGASVSLLCGGAVLGLGRRRTFYIAPLECHVKGMRDIGDVTQAPRH